MATRVARPHRLGYSGYMSGKGPGRRMSPGRSRTATAARGMRVPAAWVRLLHAHSTLVRQMDANLLAEHGLTINDYEVLLALSRADERRMRRVDLAGAVLLTQSGITRLLHGLEQSGLVAR